MEKIARAIAAFHRRDADRIAHADLLSGQDPQAMLITCSDSRMVPGVIAAADPGDLFIVRNVGNLIPLVNPGMAITHSASTGAAIEFALEVLGVKDIVVMGHRDCGAMKAIARNVPTELPLLDSWLENARPALHRFIVAKSGGGINPEIPDHDALSMINVAVQMEHLASYPSVAERVGGGGLRLHGWWFDLGSGRVRAYDLASGEFGRFEDVNSRYLEGLG